MGYLNPHTHNLDTVRYYFAARYSRNAELRTYRDDLTTALPNAHVTSRWIDQHGGSLVESLAAEQLNFDPAGCEPYAKADIEDLDAAHVVVSFTGNGGGGKGGRHIEFGYALARGKRIVIVGPRENVFHTLPAVEVYVTWPEFLAAEATRMQVDA